MNEWSNHRLLRVLNRLGDIRREELKLLINVGHLRPGGFAEKGGIDRSRIDQNALLVIKPDSRCRIETYHEPRIVCVFRCLEASGAHAGDLIEEVLVKIVLLDNGPCEGAIGHPNAIELSVSGERDSVTDRVRCVRRRGYDVNAGRCYTGTDSDIGCGFREWSGGFLYENLRLKGTHRLVDVHGISRRFTCAGAITEVPRIGE